MIQFQEQVPLAPYTTFQLGGDARYFADITNAADLGIALDYAETRNLPFVILAGGSNVLVSDTGFDGLVIHIGFKKYSIDADSGIVRAEAGASLMEVIEAAAQSGLTGMEAMYGIPGTVGGAVRGNAGAFGTEVVDVLSEVTALNISTREIKTFTHEECNCTYRSSFFKRNPEWIVLSATFALTQDTDGNALKRIRETLAMRNERQIQNIRSAGSFFMNPTVPEALQTQFQDEKGAPSHNGRVPAGWLIEKAGFKGQCVNGICTGERSANYIINDGAGSAQAVLELTSAIHAKIFTDFGITLQPEITQIGF